MAQFDFYGTWLDSWKLIEVLLKLNLLLIPDKWYKTAEIKLYNEITDELKELLYKKRRMFIFSNEYSVFIPQLMLQKSGPKQGEYSVSAECGGPCLDLTLPACFERENKIVLSSGIFTFPKEFKNPETNEWLKAPEEIKTAYKVVCNDFKKLLKQHKCNKSIWIGGDALRLLNNGEAIINDRGVVSLG